MFIQLSFATALLALLHLGAAQVPFPMRCPQVQIPTEFDLDAYMGIWYEYSKYPFVFEIGKKCMYARYEIIDNSTISVVNAAVNRFTNQPSNVTGIAKVIAPGELAVVFNRNQNPNKANYLVLGTDYDSYAVVYSCTNITQILHTKIVWILTRERKPSDAAIDAAKNIMIKNGLSLTFLIDTLQDNCTDPNAETGTGTVSAKETMNDMEFYMNSEESNVLDMA